MIEFIYFLIVFNDIFMILLCPDLFSTVYDLMILMIPVQTHFPHFDPLLTDYIFSLND